MRTRDDLGAGSGRRGDGGGRRRRGPGLVELAGTALAGALLVGCGASPVQPQAAAEVDHAVVTPRQAATVISLVDGTIGEAFRAQNADLLGNRVVGPALIAAKATLMVAAARHTTPVPPPAPVRPRLLLTRAGEWPRWFLAVGTPGSASGTGSASSAAPSQSPSAPQSPSPAPDATLPVLRVFRSPDARRPYGLWGQAMLLPGARVPAAADPVNGSLQPAADSAALRMSPNDVLAHYTELLNRGDASDFKNEFGDDDYRTQLGDQLRDYRTRFGQSGVGEVLSRHALTDEQPMVMGTADGGALVIGHVHDVHTATLDPTRGAARLTPELAALFGKPTASHSLAIGSEEVLVFAVPPKGSTAKVQLVAAGRDQTSVTGS